MKKEEQKFYENTNEEGMTLEKAEKIVDDMYQKRWEECEIIDGNTVHLGNLNNLQYSELERASIFLLRKEISFRNKNTKLKQALNEIRRYANNPFNWKYTDHYLEKDDILQIIDKVLGDNK